MLEQASASKSRRLAATDNTGENEGATVDSDSSTQLDPSTSRKRKLESTMPEQTSSSKSRRLSVADVVSTEVATGPAYDAQVAAEEAAPKRGVTFSLEKQEPQLSSPRTAQANKLKGVLKAPAPTRGNHSEDGICVEAALVSLESGDAQVRSSAYLKLRADSNQNNKIPLYLSEAADSMRAFARHFMRDMDLSNPPSLVQAALRCMDYFLSDHLVAATFTQGETESLLTQILHLINVTSEEQTCCLAICTLASTGAPSSLLLPFLPRMIQTFLSNLNPRFESPSITCECLGGLCSVFAQYPYKIVATVQAWLFPVLMKVISVIPCIRSKALGLLTMAIPKLIEKEYAKRIQAAKAFMKDFGTEFLEILAERFLNDNNEVYAITVWGALVTLLGKDLRKSSALSSMLKMAE
ncbi:hypothetical protein BX616_002441, partial [Lobosporangium transversale]